MALSGCAGYTPHPIDPVAVATAFRERSLAAPELKTFLEQNLNRPFARWPPPSWNLATLTLTALYYHPDLDVARAQWAVARAGVLTAGGRLNPTVTGSVEHATSTAGGLSPWVFGFALDTPLAFPGKRGSRIAKARQLSEAARFHIGAVAWQTRSRLRERLLDLFAARNEEVVQQRMASLQDAMTTLLEQRLAVGAASQPEVTQVHLLAYQTRAALNTAQRKREEANALLADALGLPVEAITGIQVLFEAFEQVSSTPEPFSEETRRQALTGRSDLLEALAEYAASQSGLQQEITAQYPDLSLGPGYTFDQSNNKWTLGLSLPLPLFNRNKGPIAEAKARRTESAARFTALQAAVIGEIDHAFTSYTAARRAFDAADSLTVLQQRQSQAAEARFNAGETDRLALVSARLDASASALFRLNALVELLRARSQIEDALQRPLDANGLLPPTFETAPRAKENPSP